MFAYFPLTPKDGRFCVKLNIKISDKFSQPIDSLSLDLHIFFDVLSFSNEKK
jgi:hypothetical protein